MVQTVGGTLKEILKENNVIQSVGPSHRPGPSSFPGEGEIEITNCKLDVKNNNNNRGFKKSNVSIKKAESNQHFLKEGAGHDKIDMSDVQVTGRT